MAGLSALVFDDDETYRNFLVNILTEKQIQVSAYPDPTDFLATLKSTPCIKEKPCFDFILTENKMPLMTGLAFLEKIDDMGCLVSKNKTAIITGDLSPEDIETAQNLGCRVFFKPCPIDQIFAWIDTVE